MGKRKKKKRIQTYALILSQGSHPWLYVFWTITSNGLIYDWALNVQLSHVSCSRLYQQDIFCTDLRKSFRHSHASKSQMAFYSLPKVRRKIVIKTNAISIQSEQQKHLLSKNRALYSRKQTFFLYTVSKNRLVPHCWHIKKYYIPLILSWLSLPKRACKGCHSCVYTHAHTFQMSQNSKPKLFTWGTTKEGPTPKSWHPLQDYTID